MQLQLDLRGKTVVITGSTSGIGLGIAHAFGRAGANIALNSFANTDDDHKLAKTLANKYPTKCSYFQADMSDSEVSRQFSQIQTTHLVVSIFLLIMQVSNMLRPSKISQMRRGTTFLRSISRQHFIQLPPPCP